MVMLFSCSNHVFNVLSDTYVLSHAKAKTQSRYILKFHCLHKIIKIA